MDIDGKIRIWNDQDRAFAELFIQGERGDINIRASAPLDDVRAGVARALGSMNVDVEGDPIGYDALVGRAGRRRALRYLAWAAPGAATAAVATHELRRRRRRRLAAAQEGRPIGAKPIDDEGFDREDAVEGVEVGSAAKAGTKAALTVAQTNPNVRAGMFLLKTAKRNPKAARRVRRIALRANQGDPRAQRAVRVLKVAKRVNAAQEAGLLPSGRGASLGPAPAAPPIAPPPLADSPMRGPFKYWRRGIS
jgi:hypothetical protein